jgi:hypothetical protein
MSDFAVGIAVVLLLACTPATVLENVLMTLQQVYQFVGDVLRILFFFILFSFIFLLLRWLVVLFIREVLPLSLLPYRCGDEPLIFFFINLLGIALVRIP